MAAQHLTADRLGEFLAAEEPVNTGLMSQTTVTSILDLAIGLTTLKINHIMSAQVLRLDF